MKRIVDLLEYIPEIYDNNKTMLSIQNTKSIELTNIFSDLDKAFDELFLMLAKEQGLTLYEELLEIKRDLRFSFDERREVIVAKLRGAGTTTKKLVQKVSEAYSNGEVEVIEESKGYLIKIKFVGTRGIPSNLEGLKRTLREIIPAHLEIKYLFTYLTWSEFVVYNKTVDEWNALMLTADSIRTYRGW